MVEEIIKECEFYLPLSENCNEILDDNGNELFKCSSRQGCYYKQLKRLEQERDELKKACEKCKLFDIEKTNRALLEQVDKLEQENKEFKKQIESQKGLITVGGKQQYEMTMAYDKCKTALEEIRVIADDTFKVCDDDCGNARKIKLIQDKINECIKLTL